MVWEPEGVVGGVGSGSAGSNWNNRGSAGVCWSDGEVATFEMVVFDGKKRDVFAPVRAERVILCTAGLRTAAKDGGKERDVMGVIGDAASEWFSFVPHPLSIDSDARNGGGELVTVPKSRNSAEP